jgi:hypothetical protein
MVKETRTRKASDNEYLHKDFHGALSCGIDYLEKHFGEEAVRGYLCEFTCLYYAPLIKKLKVEGLTALKQHFEKIYRIESGKIEITCSADKLILEVDACPAVMHMRKHGYIVAKLFYETTKTLNEALCKGSPFTAELIEYDKETGRSVQRFYRRKS